MKLGINIYHMRGIAYFPLNALIFSARLTMLKRDIAL